MEGRRACLNRAANTAGGRGFSKQNLPRFSMASMPPRGSSPALLSAGQRLAVSSTSSSPSQSPMRLPPLLGSASSSSPAPARPQQFAQAPSAANVSSLPSSSVSLMISFSPSTAPPKSSHSSSSSGSVSQGASSATLALARRRSSVSDPTASSSPSPPQQHAAASSSAASTSSSKSPSRPRIPLLPVSSAAPAAKQSVHESLASAMTVSAAPLSARPQSAVSAAKSAVSNAHSTSDSAISTPRRDRPRSARVAAPSSPQSARRRPSPIAPADIANAAVLLSAQDSGGPLSLSPRARLMSDGSRTLLVASPPPFPIGATAPSPASASQATASVAPQLRHAPAQSVLASAIACDFPVSASLSSDSDDLSGSQWTNLLTNYRLHNIKPAGADSMTPSVAPPRADKAAAAISNGIASSSSLSADSGKRVSAAAAVPITSPTEASDPESESYSFDSFDSPPATESKPAASAHTSDATNTRSVPKGNANALPLSAVSHVTDLSFIPRIETFAPPGQLAPTGAFGGNFESLFAHIKSNAPLASRPIASNDAGAVLAARPTDPRVLELESRLAEAEQRNQMLLAALQHVTSQRVRVCFCFLQRLVHFAFSVIFLKCFELASCSVTCH